jgi:NADPH2:quinone reductase
MGIPSSGNKVSPYEDTRPHKTGGRCCTPMLAKGRGTGSDSLGKETGMTATVARAVRFDRYGDRDVLYVQDIEMPTPGEGEVVVEVRAAGINPGEAAIRNGAMHEMFPATFPSGEGSDLAGVVTATGPEVTEFAVGDEVLGFSFQRSSHATHTVVPVNQLIRKPPGLTWEAAGSLYVVGATAYAAVRAVAPQPGETVAVSAAAGGVGSLVVQLLVLRKARVIGIAGEDNADWLRAHGVIPVTYGEGLLERLRAAAPNGIEAFIDLFGPEYVQLAVDLGVAPERIETIISFQKAGEVGAKTEGSVDASTPEVLSEIADLVVRGAVDFDIAATFPLERVADAFEELERRHTHGKIVLLPNDSP